jgi:uncharacterized SAM-binding protein YcdF (DUF218 family)
MYSQQEYEMVRRQTIQMETEKRALLRILLILMTLLLIGALVALVVTYRLYRGHINAADAAEARVVTLESQLKQTSQELQAKKTELEKLTNTATQRQAQVAALLPKVLTSTPNSAEVAEFAHAVYNSPGRSVNAPKLPPDPLFQRFWRFRNGNKTEVYSFARGQVDGQWIIYANLAGITDK